MTVVKIKPKKQTAADEDVIVLDYSKPKDGPWTPRDVYTRNPSHRRVLFLELMVWAIYYVESIDTRREWDEFKKELVKTRERIMNPRPWTKATDDECFREHVQEMAAVFANADAEVGVSYPSRKTDPLAPAQGKTS